MEERMGVNDIWVKEKKRKGPQVYLLCNKEEWSPSKLIVF